jgi:hypothetical protein
MTLDEAIKRFTSNAEFERTHGNLQGCLEFRQLVKWLEDYKRLLEQESKTDKYEYHTDHTDCIWYGNDSGCPVTCSQYRDGWNDAMDYIFKNGKGYQPYRHDG